MHLQYKVMVRVEYKEFLLSCELNIIKYISKEPDDASK